MTLLNDALGDIFRLIKLKSCVYFQRDFHAPWGMTIEGTGYAHFHVVTRGHCVVEVEGVHHNCSVGDVLLFPYGAPHTLADQPGRDAVSGAQFMSSLNGSAPYFSAGTVATRIICGHYEFKTDVAHPLLTELPEFIHISDFALMPEASTRSVLPLLMQEVADTETGSASIIERYAEVLLIQVLQAHASRVTICSGFLAGLSDRRLVRAINRIHQDFDKSIGLDDLAQAAALSRSAFSQRFKDRTGLAPIEYLAKWRMLSAADLLKETGAAISQVSAQVGYDSEIAFARAFKREFGVTPSRYRRMN